MDRNKKFRYNVGNHNATYNNPEFMTTVSLKLTEKLGRSLSSEEQRFVVNLIRKIDENYMRSRNPEDVLEALSQAILKKLIEQGKCPPMDGSSHVDMHEKLKKHIGTTSESDMTHSIYAVTYNPDTSLREMPKPSSGSISNILGIKNTIDFVKQINPASLLNKKYMLLDSRYKSQSESTNKKFVWDFSNGKMQTVGTVNIIGKIRDIISLKIFPFRLPYVADADTKQKRISVLIDEFASQSFFAHENRRFHVMCKTNIDSTFIECDPYTQNYGVHDFVQPFTTFNKISVSFGNPLQVIEFNNDNDKCSIDYFGITPLTQITTENPHNLNNGDKVYFTNFDIGPIDPLLVSQVQLNEIIKNTINRKKGFLVTVIDSTNFSINYDTSNIQNPIVDLKFNVFYDSKRFYMPVELTYINPIEY